MRAVDCDAAEVGRVRVRSRNQRFWFEVSLAAEMGALTSERPPMSSQATRYGSPLNRAPTCSEASRRAGAAPRTR